MWFPGHLAFSLLICLPFIVYMKRERALALSFLGVFALLPDYIHLGDLRGFSHSFLGLGAMLLVFLLPLILAFRPRLALVLLAITAAASHLLADTYIGTVTPFYPWDDTWFQVHAFNSAFDIRTEVILFGVAALAIAALRPLDALRSIDSYDRRERGALMVTSALVIAMAGLQGVYFLIVSQGPGIDLFRSLLLAAFAVSALFSSAFFIKTLVKKYHQKSISIAIK